MLGQVVRSEYVEEFRNVTWKICQKKRDSNGLEIDEEECKYLLEEKKNALNGACVLFRYNLFLDLYFDLILSVLISFAKSIYEYTVLIGELALWP